MDGQFYSIEFYPSSTTQDVMETIKKKIGLQENAKGYAIYEVFGHSERSLLLEEKVCDVMAKWEKFRNSTQHAAPNNVRKYILYEYYKYNVTWCFNFFFVKADQFACKQPTTSSRLFIQKALIL